MSPQNYLKRCKDSPLLRIYDSGSLFISMGLGVIWLFLVLSQKLLGLESQLNRTGIALPRSMVTERKFCCIVEFDRASFESKYKRTYFTKAAATPRRRSRMRFCPNMSSWD